MYREEISSLRNILGLDNEVLKICFFRIASLQKNLSLMCYDFDIATYVHQFDVKYLLI